MNELVRGDFRDSCPNCRHKFSNCFMEKLYSLEEYERRINHDSQWRDEEIDLDLELASPSPTTSSAPNHNETQRIPIDLGIFEEDARVQAELERQRLMAAVDEEVVMEG